MSTPARFSDEQYKNWLKCSQSLIVMKEALHDYIDNEVKILHNDITIKVSSTPCGSSTGNQCGSCSWKNIKLTGGRNGTWSINCKNSICDKWLQEILAVHDDPHNPTINWKNADISKWPIDCFQVAKIFMPKGQDKTTMMPEDLDAPAILSLMKYCNWFRNDLPNTQILSDLIDIRNKVLHSGDLRVADSDKDSWIDLMIQLLSDLKISGDAQSELQKLKREDIDINFQETEIKVLQNMMSCLENDLTTVKKDMACVKKLQSQLSEEVEHSRAKNTETTKKVKTLVNDTEQMRKSLDELKNISDKMVSFLEKNPDIYDIKITETMRDIARNVQEQERKLSKVETELMDIKDRLSKLEEEIKQLRTNQEETDNELKGLKKRLEENEEQLSLKNEATRKKRPETDGLKRLKSQTEDKLDTLRRLQCIPTKQAEKAKKLLEVESSIVIKGNPGEGKTTTALHLIDDEIYRDKRVVLNCPKEWKKVDTDWVDIVVIEDVFGQFDLDPSRLQEWMVYLPTIQEHVDAKKLQVIVTTRVDILSKAYSKVRSLKLFADNLSLTLSSEQLTNSEKMSIFSRELLRQKRNMKEDDIEESIVNFSGFIGFPQCCSLFAGDSKSFDRGPEFFRSPEKFFVSNITELDATRFLCLAFLFCNGEIQEEYLSPATMPETSKHLLMELASYLQISEEKAAITLLRDAYETFLELYIIKFKSSNSSLGSVVAKSLIKFTHGTVYEAVGQVLGERYPEMVVQYGDSEYLYDRTYTADSNDGNSQKVFIPVSVYGLLAKRMFDDVVNRQAVGSVTKHSALTQHNFLIELKGKLINDNSKKSFLMPVPKSDQPSDFDCVGYDDYEDDDQRSDFDYGGYDDYEDDDQPSDFDSDGYDDYEDDDQRSDFDYGGYDDYEDDDQPSDFDYGGYDDYEDDDDLSERNCRKSDSSIGECNSFMQYILKNDVDVVSLVYSQFLEFLACTHDKNSPDCWQCEEKQTLLELALYYHHFEIADILVTMNACYTHESLSNAARHGDLKRVQTILNTLKMRQVFNPGCKKAKDALCRAIISENQSLTEFLLIELITLDSSHVTDAVRDGDMNVLLRVVEHLKRHKKWKPHWEKHRTYTHWDSIGSHWHFSDVEEKNPCYTALFLSCYQEKFDMAEYLLKNEVIGSMYMLIGVTKWNSQQGVSTMIQILKDIKIWDPKCEEATEALTVAFRLQKNDVCDLLVQEGVLFTMKNFHIIVYNVSLEYIKEAIQNMKDADNWDPKCTEAAETLIYVYSLEKYDVCDLLVQEGVSLTMKNLHDMIYRLSFESIKKAIKNMKDVDNWDPTCDDSSKAFQDAYLRKKYDVCDLLVQEGVLSTMKNLPGMVCNVSFEYIKKAIQNMKVTDNWDPKCNDAFKALQNTCLYGKYDVCDLLVQEGVFLTIENLRDTVNGASYECVRKAVQNMKDTNSWDPKCSDASKALEIAYSYKKYDVCNLLVHEGVSLTMNNLPVMVSSASCEYINKAIQNLKDTHDWDPKCDAASLALQNAYANQKYEVCHLLVQAGVSLTMKNIPDIVYKVSLENIKKAILNMKGTEKWNPKCNDGSMALANAYRYRKYDVCDLLVQEGVSVTMKNVSDMVYRVSFEQIMKAIQNMKHTDNWDPKCEYASQAFQTAYKYQKYDVCDLLVKEGVSLTMKKFPLVVKSVSCEYVKKEIQNLKEADNWDPECDEASEALKYAYTRKEYGICDLIVQEGVKPAMKNLVGVTNGYDVSLETVRKVIQHLKDTKNWNPKSYYASGAFDNAYGQNMHDVCDLLLQEGVSLAMENLCNMTSSASLEYIKKVIQHLKGSDNWDPKCDDASKAFDNAYRYQKYDVCDLLNQEGVSLTMKNLLDMAHCVSFEYIKETIQNMKEKDNWNPKCDDVAKAFKNAYSSQKYDVCDLLIQEGVLTTIKELPIVVYSVQLKTVMIFVQHLKDTDNWDPKSEDASEALENAYRYKKYDVCDLLVQEGVSLTMRNITNMVFNVSLEYIKIAIQNMKDSASWDPKCDVASKALESAYMHTKYDVCDLLVQEGVSLTMKNLPNIVGNVSFPYIKKAIYDMKDCANWDPKCDVASKSLESAYRHMKYDVCDLLVQEGVSLTMSKLPYLVYTSSLESVKKIIQHLEYTNNWNPKCCDASKALENSYGHRKYDVCDLLIQEGVSLTMNILPTITGECFVSFEGKEYDCYDLQVDEEDTFKIKKCFNAVDFVPFEYIKTAIKNMKDNDNWDPKCDDASKAFEIAYRYKKYDVCTLLVQEGVSLTMSNFPNMVYNVSLEYIKIAIQNMKDSANWDPKCDVASKSLESAYRHMKYDVCDLLVQEGVSLTMCKLPDLVYTASLEAIKKIIQDLEYTNNWDPKCCDASKALENSYRHLKYDVCDLLVQEGVSLTMNILPTITGECFVSFEGKEYDCYDLQVDEEVPLKMKKRFNAVDFVPFEYIKTAIKNMKDNDNWDPKCDDASKALGNAYRYKRHEVCDLLVQEGVSLTMRTIPNMVYSESLEYIKNAIQNMKDSNNWDPNCDDAFKSLGNAYRHTKYDVCDLLVQEGVSLTMSNLPDMVCNVSFEYIKKAIQNMKDTENWDPTCDDASNAFENAYRYKRYDVCDLLIQEGVSLTMKNLPSDVYRVPFKTFENLMQHLKDTDNWNPKCDNAYEAFTNAYRYQRYDVCDLLVQEGVLQTKQ